VSSRSGVATLRTAIHLLLTYLLTYLLEAQAPHSGDSLLALPVTVCRLRLEDEAVRIAVALRLGSELGSPHACRCGSSLVHKQARSRDVRHHALNDCVSRAIPVRKEPAGRVQKDGKRPDGCTVIPWRGDRPLAWDVTVCTTAAASYVTAASQSAGAATEQATERKFLKYAELSDFQPVAVETHGPMDEATISFISEWGARSRNTRAIRLTVVTISGESACSYSDITTFSSVRPFRLKTKSTRSYFSLVLVIF